MHRLQTTKRVPVSNYASQRSLHVKFVMSHVRARLSAVGGPGLAPGAGPFFSLGCFDTRRLNKLLRGG